MDLAAPAKHSQNAIATCTFWQLSVLQVSIQGKYRSASEIRDRAKKQTLTFTSAWGGPVLSNVTGAIRGH